MIYYVFSYTFLARFGKGNLSYTSINDAVEGPPARLLNGLKDNLFSWG